jgi:hypothetical protein
MARTIPGEQWTLNRWPRELKLDEDLGRTPAMLPLSEEIRIVAALVGLACLAILAV